MKRRTYCQIVIAASVVLLCMATLIKAQGPTYDLSWNTIDGGGHTFSTSSGYELGGTIGQPDAGVLSGGGYTLSGGFWSGVASLGAGRVYLPTMLR